MSGGSVPVPSLQVVWYCGVQTDKRRSSAWGSSRIFAAALGTRGWVIDLVQSHLGLIYQIQGIAFVALGILALVLPRRAGAIHLAPHLPFLAVFGLLHGLAVFLAWEYSRQPAHWLQLMLAVVLPLSYLALMEFGRRTLAVRWSQHALAWWAVYVPATALFIAVVVAAREPLDGITAASRYALGFPAALLTATALWAVSTAPSERTPVAPHRPWLYLGVAAFAVYGMLIPILSAQVAGLPTWLPTEQHFLEWTGVPVRLGRGLATVLATVALLSLVRQVTTSSSEDLERLLGTISGFVYRCENRPDWPATFVAGDMEGVTGRPASALLDGGELALEDLIHPEDREYAWAETQAALRQGRDYQMEVRLNHDGPETRWLFDRGRAVADADDNVLFLEGQIVETTTLRRVQSELEQFQATLDRSLDAVFIIDADTLTLTYVNDGAATQFKRSRDELLRLRAHELFAGYSEVGLREAVRPLVAGDQPLARLEVSLQRSDGGTTPVDLALQYVRPSSGPARFIAIARDISDRLQAEAEVREAKERLERAERTAMLGHWELDLDRETLHWSRELYRLLGFDEERTLPSVEEFMERLHPQDRQRFREGWEAICAGIDSDVRELRTNPECGHMRHLAVRYWRVEGGPGAHGRLAGTVQDVTAYQQVVQELRESERQQRDLRTLAQREQGRMAALLSGMSIGILFQETNDGIEYVNPAFRRIWGIDEHAVLIGRPTEEVLAHSTHRFSRPNHASRYVLQVLDTHEISERFEIELYDGRILTQVSYPVSDSEGRLIGRLWIYEDVTHERQTVQQLVYLAEHDALTGLHNRHRFQEHLDRMIKTARRMESRFALMYFDLDEFKHINDNFGHRAGDTVLVRTAGEISSLVRGGELLARLGGDEFAILVEMARDEDPVHLAERVIHAISSIPLRFRGTNLRLTASVGIAYFPDHGTEADDLVAQADAAMYQAKNLGKNTWAVYDPARSDPSAGLERMSWSRRIAGALEDDRLELHFQGVYTAAECRLSHLEALVRMRDTSDWNRLLMPGQFIPVAEKTGQILELDRWVLRRSIAILARHAHLPGLAVNISGRSIDEPGLPQFIQRLLQEHEVTPERLILELTETAAVAEMQNAQRFIEQMHLAGCSVCLDDFGSGFATFSYLKYLAVRTLKIDGMFVRDLAHNPDNQAFVRAMIDVAAGLGKRTVAEFVEDARTLEMLQDLGVDLVQGYYLDTPVAGHPALRDA